jgi:hypothetical protein
VSFGRFKVKCGVSTQDTWASFQVNVILDRRVLDLAPLFPANIENRVGE